MSDGTNSLAPAADALAFIDLARLGRTDWRSTGKAVLKILGWQVLMIAAVAAAALGARQTKYQVRPDDPIVQVLALALTTAAWYVGLYGAVVKSQGRPFLSLLAIDRQLDLRRVGLGVLLWFASWVPAAALAGIFFDLAGPAAPETDSLELAWPPARELLLAAALSLPIFFFQAAAEELVFRGWLTQTLGQIVRRVWLVALIVALLFAAGHFFAGGVIGFLAYATMSLGFSALTLLDQRLELAIGLHAANNIFVITFAVFYVPPDAGPGLIHYPDVMPWTAVPTIMLQYVIAYGLVRWAKRAGWANGRVRRIDRVPSR